MWVFISLKSTTVDILETYEKLEEKCTDFLNGILWTGLIK